MATIARGVRTVTGEGRVVVTTGTYAVPMTRAGRAGAVTVAVGAAVVIIGSSMTWLRSGTRHRSSYEVFALVDRLGFAPNGAIGWAVRLWPLVPLLVTAAAVLAWQSRRWALLVVAVAAGVYAGGVALAVTSADAPRMLRVAAGPAVTACGATLVVVGAVITSFATFRVHGDS